ncbi:uncharacterized protein LOC101857100 [Aplysia californica]|uniref:Uncharacterized protein LOC101857100 n=1 Tax=Aplysia californica TaxID=6500 RepID=A0ABM0ZXA9_APLCA|nr:uncharacterized protein LOC101857100 [Aplysia californica]
MSSSSLTVDNIVFFPSTGGRTGLWCQVHIRVCSTCKLSLHLEELSFAACTTRGRGRRRRPNQDWCYNGCDHIHLHEVDPPYDEVTHRDYFLENEGDHYISISGNIKVRHCAGNTSLTDGRRFKIAYKVIDKTELHQGVVSEYGDNTGVVTSPNFPHGYALNGEAFTFMIQNLDPYGYVRLTFDDWDIAPESKIKVYDGFSEGSSHVTLERFRRPVIVSESNTLVLVLSTGTQKDDCCYHSGFKARYQFVSERQWKERPDVSCSETHPLQGGGTLSFTRSSNTGSLFYDCVWLIKRYNRLNTADAVVLRLIEVLLGDGWLKYGKRNSLEIRHGVTSEAPLLARYTARNLTDIEMSITAPRGLYIRLRGGFYTTDKLSFMYTAVKNVTLGGEGCPGYFDYLCHNLLCIDQELMCDGDDHCGDGSDESPLLDCTVSLGSTQASRPPCDGVVVCGSECLTLDQICDGVPDCPGREDEDNCVFSAGDYF